MPVQGEFFQNPGGGVHSMNIKSTQSARFSRDDNSYLTG